MSSMESASSPQSSNAEPTVSRRTAVRQDRRHVERRLTPPAWLIIVAALLVGAVIGGFTMRHRYIQKSKETILSINGDNITKDEFQHRLEMTSGQQILRQMMDERLTLQYAQKHGLSPTQADIEAKFKEAMQRPDFKDTLAERRQSPEDFKAGLRVALATTNVLSQGMQVTEEELRRFYNANITKNNPKARFYTPETVQVAIIVTRTENRGRQALAELQKDIPFEQVAQQFSEDTSKNAGGLLAPIPKGRTNLVKIPSLENTLFGLKIGQQIGPQKFAGAYWIIRCLEKTSERTLSFPQVKEECRTQVLLSKGAPKNTDKLKKDFETFRNQARIQAFWDRYSDFANKSKQ